MAARMTAAEVPQETVEAMAAYYGLKLPEEKYMLWIARQACVEPLPEGYQEFQDDDGNTFYFNSQTQESTFENPLDETFKFLINKERQKYKESIKAAAEAIGADTGGDTAAAAFTRPRRGRGGRGRSAGRTATVPALVPAPAAVSLVPAASAASSAADQTSDAAREMAEYLGINPETEPHLMWIAAAALQDQILPPEWHEYADEHGNRYYHNTITNLTTYDHPLDEKHKKTIERERAAASPWQMSTTDAATARAVEAAAERARLQAEQAAAAAAAAAEKKLQEELAEAAAAAERKVRQEAAAAAALAEQRAREEAIAVEAAARRKAEEELVAAQEAEQAKRKAEAEAAAREAEEVRRKAEAEAAAEAAEKAREAAAAEEAARLARVAAENAAAEKKMQEEAAAEAAALAAVAAEAAEAAAAVEATPKHGRRRGVMTVANSSQAAFASPGSIYFASADETRPKVAHAVTSLPRPIPEPEPELQQVPQSELELKPAASVMATGVIPLAKVAAPWLSANSPSKGGEDNLVQNDLAAARLAELAAKREEEAAQAKVAAEAKAEEDAKSAAAAETIARAEFEKPAAAVVLHQAHTQASAREFQDPGDAPFEREKNATNANSPPPSHGAGALVTQLPRHSVANSTISTMASAQGSLDADQPKSPRVDEAKAAATVDNPPHAAPDLVNSDSAAVEQTDEPRLQTHTSNSDLVSSSHDLPFSARTITQTADVSTTGSSSPNSSRRNFAASEKPTSANANESQRLAPQHVIPTVHHVAEPNFGLASTASYGSDTAWLQRMFEKNEQERKHQESIIEAQKQQLERMERLLHDRSRVFPGEAASFQSQEARTQAWMPMQSVGIGSRNSPSTPASTGALESSFQGVVASAVTPQQQRADAWVSVSPPKVTPAAALGHNRNFVATFVSAVSSLRRLIEQSATDTDECASVVSTISGTVSPIASLLRNHVQSVCDDAEIRHVQNALSQFDAADPCEILRASLTVCSVLGRIAQQRKQTSKRPLLAEEPGSNRATGGNSLSVDVNAAEALKEMLHHELQKKEIERLRLENEQLRQAKLNATSSFADNTVSDLASSLRLLLSRLSASDASHQTSAPQTTAPVSTSPAVKDRPAEATSGSSPESKLQELYLKLKDDSGSDMEVVAACLKHAFWAVGDGQGRLELGGFHDFIAEMCATLSFECEEEETVAMFDHVCGRSLDDTGIRAEDLLEAMKAAVSESHHVGTGEEHAEQSEIEQPADSGTLVGKSAEKSEPDDDIKHGQNSQVSTSDCGLSDTSSNVSSAPSLASVRGLCTTDGSDPSAGPEPNDVESSTDLDAHHSKSAGPAESIMNSRTVSPENGWRIPTAATSDAVPTNKSEITQSFAAEAEQALSSAGVQDRTVAGMYTRYLEARGRGQSDVVVRSACGQVVNACTAAATKHLQDDNFGVVWQLLSFAQECSAEYQQLWSGIYNCKACFCQRQGKHLRALRYLRRAAEVNATWKLGAEQRANTHLNMCAVLSRLQRHKKSLDAAQMALRWAKAAVAEARKCSPAAGESGVSSRLVDAGTLVALALHNAAVQHEHLREYSDARAAYRSAVHTASQCLGEHTITKTILANLQRCEAAAAAAGQRKLPAHLRSSASVPSISRSGSSASLPRVQY